MAQSSETCPVLHARNGWLVFAIAFDDAAPNMAALAAVEEIDHQSQASPYRQNQDRRERQRTIKYQASDNGGRSDDPYGGQKGRALAVRGGPGAHHPPGRHPGGGG